MSRASIMGSDRYSGARGRHTRDPRGLGIRRFIWEAKKKTVLSRPEQRQVFA